MFEVEIPSWNDTSKDSLSFTVKKVQQLSVPALPSDTSIPSGAGGKKKRKRNKKKKGDNSENATHLRIQKEESELHEEEEESSSDETVPPSSANVPEEIPAYVVAQPAKKTKKGGSILTQLKAKLEGGRFRWLNEQLYTTTGKDAFQTFQENPDLFEEYHKGFRVQAENWPINPLDLIIKQISKESKKKVVADMGCGDAVLAEKVPNKVHSFDLVSTSPRVIACDITKQVPLPPASVDFCVFCLSLMNTNFEGSIQEAFRILKPNGSLKIAEVISRFPDVRDFVVLLENHGFMLQSQDIISKMFILFEFKKSAKKTDEYATPGAHERQGRKKRKRADSSGDKPTFEFKPCIYKRR
eukprot:GCRY01001318.1.p1 GENE.GCRY01001318.1~~GCRY01001318.1.p1  ORF type:complete len:355 (+),score=61.02 GCRY01001318.1:157-1221(+)